MTEYIIYKNSRLPGKESYSGPTWDKANLRGSYQKTYSDYEYAVHIARILTMHNPVGFSVAKVYNRGD